MNAAITLASYLFGYNFDEAILRLGQNCVEHVRQLGIVSDMFYHMSDSEFRHTNGEMVVSIQDNSNEIFDFIKKNRRCSGQRFGWSYCEC